MSKFKIGQKAVTIADGEWHTCDILRRPIMVGFWPFKRKKKVRGPRFHEIVTVTGLGDGTVENCINIKFYTGNFHDSNFEPISDISEVEELLNMNKEPSYLLN